MWVLSFAACAMLTGCALTVDSPILPTGRCDVVLDFTPDGKPTIHTDCLHFPSGKVPIRNRLAARNNNPLNIKPPVEGGKWAGQIGVDSYGHARFETLADGIQAASTVLKSYAKAHGIKTLRGIVNRFSESNKQTYLQFLETKLGVKADTHLDVQTRLPELLCAMSQFELGERLPQWIFRQHGGAR